MKLADKIDKARAVVLENLSPNAILYCSFGKDSMVLLHLTRAMGLDFPIMFHHTPFFPKKIAFANGVIEAWNLTVYRQQPTKVGIVREPQLDFINEYSARDGKTIAMPVGLMPLQEGLPFLCGLRDLMGTPRSVLVYPWDTALIGHKSSDHDPLFGDIPLKGYVAQITPSMKAVFPLRDFTDADVWAYTEQFNVPFNDRRYNKADGYKEFEDITYNNDYYHTCTKCMSPTEPEQVECPKFGVVPNVSAVVPVANIHRLAYMEEVPSGT